MSRAVNGDGEPGSDTSGGWVVKATTTGLRSNSRYLYRMFRRPILMLAGQTRLRSQISERWCALQWCAGVLPSRASLDGQTALLRDALFSQRDKLAHCGGDSRKNDIESVVLIVAAPESSDRVGRYGVTGLRATTRRYPPHRISSLLQTSAR
jgi:hypothetical protein